MESQEDTGLSESHDVLFSNERLSFLTNFSCLSLVTISEKSNERFKVRLSTDF